jgi:hypothetical protein
VDAYTRARTVSTKQVADELGWSYEKAGHRLLNHLWLVRRLKRGTKWDAHVIDVLRSLYNQAPDQPVDFLSDWLKTQEIACPKDR